MNGMINSILFFWVFLLLASSRSFAEAGSVSNLPQGAVVDHHETQQEAKPNIQSADLVLKNEPIDKDSKSKDSNEVFEKTAAKVTNEVKNPAESVTGLSHRDPFRPPEYIILKVRQKAALAIKNDNVFDESIEPVRRWPLASYKLVGIIWEVHKPKAMFLDRSNNVHMLQTNDFIGNSKGVVISIDSGSVTVLEGKIPQVIKLKK